LRPNIDYGTNGKFNPIDAILNGAFDILRNGYDSRKITRIQWVNGYRNVTRILINSPEIVGDFNRDHEYNFWETQALPLSWTANKASWVPNYQTHIVGEGYICRQLAEWYQYRQVPAPYLWAVLTSFSYQYTNEAVENGPSTNDSIDPIADILIFNPIGWGLFYFDPVAKFFSQTLHMQNWSLQPVFNPYNSIMSNAGEQFVIKIDLPMTETYQVFYGWGIDGTLGVTYNGEKGRNISLGIGAKANRLKESIRLRRRWVYPEMKPNFVLYLDKMDSLLLSINQTGIDEINLTVNAFPGLISKKFGLYLAAKQFLGIHIGVIYNGVPLGLFAGE